MYRYIETSCILSTYSCFKLIEGKYSMLKINFQSLKIHISSIATLFPLLKSGLLNKLNKQYGLVALLAQ